MDGVKIKGGIVVSEAVLKATQQDFLSCRVSDEEVWISSNFSNSRLSRQLARFIGKASTCWIHILLWASMLRQSSSKGKGAWINTRYRYPQHIHASFQRLWMMRWKICLGIIGMISFQGMYEIFLLERSREWCIFQKQMRKLWKRQLWRMCHRVKGRTRKSLLDCSKKVIRHENAHETAAHSPVIWFIINGFRKLITENPADFI